MDQTSQRKKGLKWCVTVTSKQNLSNWIEKNGSILYTDYPFYGRKCEANKRNVTEQRRKETKWSHEKSSRNNMPTTVLFAAHTLQLWQQRAIYIHFCFASHKFNWPKIVEVWKLWFSPTFTTNSCFSLQFIEIAKFWNINSSWRRPKPVR